MNENFSFVKKNKQKNPHKCVWLCLYFIMYFFDIIMVVGCFLCSVLLLNYSVQNIKLLVYTQGHYKIWGFFDAVYGFICDCLYCAPWWFLLLIGVTWKYCHYITFVRQILQKFFSLYVEILPSSFFWQHCKALCLW